MKKVLLLNPPGKKYFIRDYYCSQVSKGAYYWPPLDLLVLSGVLKGHCEIKVVDALIAKLTPEATYGVIQSFSPDYIVALAGAASWNNDLGFLAKLKEIWGGYLIISGDYPLARPQEVIKRYPFIDGVLLDFTDSGIIELISQNKSNGAKNILTRFDNVQAVRTFSPEFSIPVPSYRDFQLEKYHLPHLYYHPFATIMTDFGCPFHCTFCPYERIEYKLRSMENVFEELSYLRALGIREIWLRDQSFGSVKRHALEFCRLIKEFNGFFSWSCEMRVDAADEELLTAMKKSGCHTVMFGVETAQEDVLCLYKKGITLEQVRRAFLLAQKFGIRRLAHFIIGLDGETKESQDELIDFSLLLNPEYASFNIAAPLWNTTFHDEAVKNSWINKDIIEIDSSCSYPAWENRLLTKREIWGVRNKALRKFYLRPAYIMNQARNLKTKYQLYSLVREGCKMARNLCGLS